MYAQQTQEKIVALVDAGISSRKVANLLNVSKSGVNDFITRKQRELEFEQCPVQDVSLSEQIHGWLNLPSSVYVPPVNIQPQPKEDNSRILFISDMHIPFHHKGMMDFLKALKWKYNPTRIICLGDEQDFQSQSFHVSDQDLPSAGDELKQSQRVMKELESLFPVMDIVHSNHGSMVWRKAKEHGIPRHFIKSYNEALGVGDGWKWHKDLVVTLPDGHKVYVHHGKSNRAIKTSQAMGMSHVCGHYHNSFAIEYWANPNGIYFGMNCGCLIDDDSLAFAYNNVNMHRPIIGTGLIIDGKPILEPMPL